MATVGPSITIEGEVSGEEDLLIEGRVVGRISLRNNAVTIGESGRLQAQVVAKSITVEGEVEGDLLGEQDVVVKPSGSVHGNIKAPRVSLESGCRFQGSIDMEKAAAPKVKEPAAPRPTAPERAEGTRSAPSQPAVSSSS